MASRDSQGRTELDNEERSLLIDSARLAYNGLCTRDLTHVFHTLGQILLERAARENTQLPGGSDLVTIAKLDCDCHMHVIHQQIMANEDIPKLYKKLKEAVVMGGGTIIKEGEWEKLGIKDMD